MQLFAAFVLLLTGRAAADSSLPPLGLTSQNLNRRVVNAEYAVRGRLLDRAKELEKAGRSIVRCNIGNPQALGQRALSWVRAVLSLCTNPELLEAAEAAHASGAGGPLAELYPADAVVRAREYLTACGSVGAYSDSQGVGLVREQVAAFLRERDGSDCSADDVFLTDGASAGVRMLMQCLLADPGVDAVLAPSPVYPLYSALTTILDGATALYPLHENFDTGVWTVRLADLQASLKTARTEGSVVRALVIINPGNPTGQCMSKAEVRAVLEFAAKEGLVLLADEVYQDNVYNAPGTTRLAHVSNEFHSFRAALQELTMADAALASRVQGFSGECGLRGGFFALDGHWEASVKAQLIKLASICLCSNVMGQLTMGCVIAPPTAGSPSYETYVSERESILESLRTRANTLALALDDLAGVTCAPAEGALYLFPRIELPIKAIAAAREAKVPPDEFYALKMLDATGLVVVPGSGFGQPDPYAFHVRTTFLPPADQLEGVTKAIAAFHTAFLEEYASVHAQQ